MKLVLIIAVVCMLGAPARAEETDPTMRQLVGGAMNRARRAIAIGPSVGTSVDTATSPADVDIPISFGLHVALFKVPIAPSRELLMELVKKRAKEEALRRLAAQNITMPTQADIDRVVAQVIDDVRAEVLGMHNRRSQVLEKPRAALALEAGYLPRASDWQVRTTLRIGVSKISIGPTFRTDFAMDTALYLGPEVALSLLPRKSSRSPVIDVFARGDFGLNDAAASTHIGVGARFVLDLI